MAATLMPHDDLLERLDIDSLARAVVRMRTKKHNPAYHLELHAPDVALRALRLVWRGVYGGIGSPFGLCLVAHESDQRLGFRLCECPRAATGERT